jgi:hypothetical protein
MHLLCWSGIFYIYFGVISVKYYFEQENVYYFTLIGTNRQKCVSHPNAVSLPGLAPQQTHRHTRGTEYAKQTFLHKQKYSSNHPATNISIFHS